MNTSFYLPNDPISDDHHRLTAGFQKLEQCFSSWLHFAECRAQDNAEHNHAKNICIAGVGRFVIQFVIIIAYDKKKMFPIR